MKREKERLIGVLSGLEVDRAPCICPGGMMNMITSDIICMEGVDDSSIHTCPETMARLAMRVNKEDCFENIGLPFCMTIEAELLGAPVDLGCDVVEPHVKAYCYNSVDEWDVLPIVNHHIGRGQVVLDAIKIIKRMQVGTPIIGNVTGPISTAASLIEPVDFYKSLRKNPESAHKFLSVVTESILTFAKLQIEAGADVIALSEPSGTGEILGPKLFGEFVVPYINRITETVLSLGAKSIVHICGKMDKAYGEMANIHADALSFDALVNMREARSALTNRCLMGNVSTYALEFATPDKITQLTKLCLKQGVDIVAPACGLGMKSPTENIQAMTKAVREVCDV